MLGHRGAGLAADALFQHGVALLHAVGDENQPTAGCFTLLRGVLAAPLPFRSAGAGGDRMRKIVVG